MYFKKLPDILYPFNIDGKNQFLLLKDISVNVRFVREVLSNISLYDEYDIIDGETPEIISEKFYGTPEYHWIIMLSNERYDYLTDFPIPYKYFNEYVANKYGEANVYAVHHYENSDGYTVESTDPVYLVEQATNRLYRPGATVDHGLTDNNPIVFYSVTNASPLQINTTYYVVNSTRTSFELSTSVGGATIDITTDGTVTSNLSTVRTAVTNYEYEERLNESKRRIKIIDKKIINQVINEFNKALS